MIKVRYRSGRSAPRFNATRAYRLGVSALLSAALLLLVLRIKKESAPRQAAPQPEVTEAAAPLPDARTRTTIAKATLPKTSVSKKRKRAAMAARPAAPSTIAPPEDPPEFDLLTLPVKGVRRTGDLNQMVKRRDIRALVLVNPIGFFYDKGQPKGTMYEALQEFERFLNKRYKPGHLNVRVTFHPVSPAQVEAALRDGLGDIIAYGINITPSREERVAFAVPFQTDLTQIIVAGPKFGPVSRLEDLSGKEVYANPIMSYYDNLEAVSEALEKAGKPPIDVKAADKNLLDDDLVQMVNAGLIPATVTTKQRADFWSQVLDHLTPHPELVIFTGGRVAWAMRKNNPQLKRVVDEFEKTHAVGTEFGNVLLRRYLKNTKWVKESTSEQEMKKFQATVELFRKYADRYSFDYLMLLAQGYQESMLDQSKVNGSGAVGVMQVIPKYAAAPPIEITNVKNIDGNIHAGVKMLRNIADTYLNDPTLDPSNKILLAFASYNAGPTRIAQLRVRAASMGLNPNLWFGNMEVATAKDIGQETVTYVGNIYKYYVAYKLALEQLQVKREARIATIQ
jgi:membrane-bound lytic murein transglycosylase MltF